MFNSYLTYYQRVNLSQDDQDWHLNRIPMAQTWSNSLMATKRPQKNTAWISTKWRHPTADHTHPTKLESLTKMISSWNIVVGRPYQTAKTSRSRDQPSQLKPQILGDPAEVCQGASLPSTLAWTTRMTPWNGREIQERCSDWGLLEGSVVKGVFIRCFSLWWMFILPNQYGILGFGSSPKCFFIYMMIPILSFDHLGSWSAVR